MARCECPEESVQQSVHSPGVVSDSESIVYALVEPLTYQGGSVTAISKGKLQRAEQSVCRAEMCTGDFARTKIVDALREKDPTRLDHGFVYAPASEIRSITLGNTSEGAFCVVDDGLEDFEAHAILSFSIPSDIKFRSHREAARGNLLLLFKQRGEIKNWDSPPFQSP